MIDFLIVGGGLAGFCFAETALQNNHSIMVIANQSQNSSTIAAGLYNPVVLKRFTAVWKAKQQLDLAAAFYKDLEKKLQTTFNYEIPIYRRFASIEEQNNWFQAADKPFLDTILSSKTIKNTFSEVIAPLGFGEVNETGYLEVNKMLQAYSQYLTANQLLINATFDYSKLDSNEDCISYEGIQAKNIVFAEGFGIHANPYFIDFPVNGTKGELLIIKSVQLKIDVIIKSNIFIIPLGDDLYKVGATYNWQDKTANTTIEGKNELIENLKDLINCEFEIISHFAGVRPTVVDRRPLVGTHNLHQNIHLLNGLGTRGVLLGPFLADQLFQSITNQVTLDNEIDIKRVYKKQAKTKK